MVPPSDLSEGDEVDGILKAWRSPLPRADLTPLSVFSRVSRLARHLDQARREAFSSVDLEPWAFDVLSALRRAGEPFSLTPGVLMQQSLVSSGTMTNRIDRLEERGLVRRCAILVELTEDGNRHADAAITKLMATERDWLGDLSEADVNELARLLRAVLLPFDAQSR